MNTQYQCCQPSLPASQRTQTTSQWSLSFRSYTLPWNIPPQYSAPQAPGGIQTKLNYESLWLKSSFTLQFVGRQEGRNAILGKRFLFFFFFFFLSFQGCTCGIWRFPGLHLWHMEVPRLGAESELWLLAYTTATATLDP